MSHPPNTMSSSPDRGTTSLIFGDRPSVRLPRRIVPICVSEPIGLARPRRIARTPAMVVVLTAPSPTSRIPSFPFAGAISAGLDTGKNHIIVGRMLPAPRKTDPYMLVTGMASVKMGHHLVQIGCAHGGRLGAIAVNVGLSGRAVAYVPDAASGERARKGAAEAGVLVDVEIAPPSRLPAEAESFDVAVVDDTGGLLAT